MKGVNTMANISEAEIRKIVDIMLGDLVKRLKEQELSLDIPDEVKDWLANKGYNSNYGARPLRRVIQKKIEDPIAEEILTAHYKHGDTIGLYFHQLKKKRNNKKNKPVKTIMRNNIIYA